MASIFLSYSREDRACAETLARVLERAGHGVWWDRQIVSGHEFAPEIEAALETADLVLVAWSKHSAKSPWVRDEAAIGRDSGRLLPVVIDRSQAPIGFRQFQVLDLSGWKGHDSDSRTVELVDTVEARLTGKSPAVRSPRKRLGWLTDRRVWTAAAAFLFAVVAVTAVLILRPGGAQAEPASLAVLPFKNMSAGDPYFAEGVAEEISDQLSREPQFTVIGRTSASLFKDAADLRDVGRRLHVSYVLEGSVRSAGSQVRVDVALVETRKGVRLWSQDFRGSLNDIFAIQDQIGQQVAAHVRRQLIRQVLPAAMQTTGDVYSLYVTAKSLIRQRQPANIAAAAELLQRAVKLDPNYAPAWARLAQAVRFSRFYGHEEEPHAGWLRADELRDVEHAIALAPDLAEGHAILGMFLGISPNSDPAMKKRGRAELERAIKLNPHDAEFWYWLYQARRSDLDFEGALEAVRHTAEIDPFFTYSDFYPDLAWEMGDHEAAIRFLNNRIQNHPEPYIRARSKLVLAELQHDWSTMYESAKQMRDLAPPDMRGYAQDPMGFMLLRTGLTDESRRFLPSELIDQFQGVGPAAAELRSGDPLDFWLGGPAPLTSRALINSGRAAELVSLYERAFGSPGGMVTRLDKPDFIELAPIAASGLRAVGRNDEAMRILAAADRLCAYAMSRGRTPVSFQVDCSRSWAMLGRRDAAIATLQRAFTAGWRPGGGWSWAIVDDPPYREVRDDPRLKRLGALVLAENAREGREIKAAGI